MYSTRIEELGGGPIEFGTSGLLYRSNKLMYDRATNTLWRQFVGEPVVGPLANSGIKLEVFPVTVTTWAAWSEMHPDTTVLSQHTGVYPAGTYLPETNPRAIYYDYFARSDTMFPVWLRDDALPTKESVLGVLVRGVPKAYALRDLAANPVVNDTIAGAPVVVISSPFTGSARAYLRQGVEFVRVPQLTDIGDTVADVEGRQWRITEEALVRTDDPTITLSRLPTHMAFWFGWYASYPNTLLFSG